MHRAPIDHIAIQAKDATELGVLIMEKYKKRGESRGMIWAAAALVVALLLVNLIPTGAMAATSGDYQYKLIENGNKVEIVRYTGSGGSASIPASLEGKPVTCIGRSAFAYATVTSVSFPDSVTNISVDAFSYCYNLVSVQFGSNLTYLESDAFNSCTSLLRVEIPGNVSSIGGYPFIHCTALLSINVSAANANYASLEGVLYNKDLTTLIQYPCGKVGAFAVPSSVNTIAAYAFAYSPVIRVDLPASVMTIAYMPFMECLSLTNISVADDNPVFASQGGVLYNKAMTTLMAYPAGLAGAFVLPENVTTVGNYAFSHCRQLTSVHLGGNITTLGNQAFAYCFGLVTVTIPENVTSIGTLPFYVCSALLSIEVAPSNPSYASASGILYTKNLATLIEAPGGIAGSLIIPAGVTFVSQNAFAYCQHLESVIVPNSTTALGDSAFTYCYNLTSVTLSNGLISLGTNAFYENFGLRSIIIPASVASIQGGAFNDCRALTLVQFEGNAPTCGANVFYAHNSTLIAYYHGGATGFTNPWQGIATSQMSVPGMPANFTATAGRLQVQLNWTAPSDGNVSVSGYTVYFGNGSTPDQIFGSYGPSTLAVNVTGLRAETQYVFGVVATNAIGNSSMPLRVATPYDVPQQPGWGMDLGYQSASFHWIVDGDGGRPITGFTIYGGLSQYSLQVVGSAGASDSRTIITNITGGLVYWFALTASNVGGESSIGFFQDGMVYTIPGQPRNVTATAGQVQVSIAWTAPLFDGGSAITSYKVYRQLAGGNQLIATCGPEVFSCTDSSVTAGIAYSYTVNACNAGGSNASTTVTATPTAAPADSGMTYLIVGLLIVVVAAVAVVLYLRGRKKA